MGGDHGYSKNQTCRLLALFVIVLSQLFVFNIVSLKVHIECKNKNFMTFFTHFQGNVSIFHVPKQQDSLMHSMITCRWIWVFRSNLIWENHTLISKAMSFNDLF